MSIVALDRKSIIFAGKLFQILAFAESGNYQSCDPDLGHCLREVNSSNLSTHFIDGLSLSERKSLISITKQKNPGFEEEFWPLKFEEEAIRRCMDPELFLPGSSAQQLLIALGH